MRGCPPVLTEDVKFREPDDRERVLGKEREVVAGLLTVAALRLNWRAVRAKPLTAAVMHGQTGCSWTNRRQAGLARRWLVVADLFRGWPWSSPNRHIAGRMNAPAVLLVQLTGVCRR
jgi:hypothetical protein